MLAPISIDKKGHLTLPKQALDVLGVAADTEIVIEVTETEVLLKPKRPSLTERLGAMELPVADWDNMEKEIELGRLAL